MKFLGLLVGRTFSISTEESARHWNGINENDEGISDYDLLDEDVMQDELFNSFQKDKRFYLILKSMSTKIVLFKTENGLVILDSLYFNADWDYQQNFEIVNPHEQEKIITIETGRLVIFDSTLSAEELFDSLQTDEQGEDYSFIDLNSGDYKVSKVIAKIEVQGTHTNLDGVEIALSWS